MGTSFSKIKFFGCFLFLTFYVGAALAIEEPKYTVVSKNENYEIRLYEPTLVAQTTVDSKFDDASNEAFRILADYIFGKNKTKESIAMTAPVAQQPSSQKIAMTAPVSQIKSPTGFLVQFTMPAKYTLDTLPSPIDPRVEIVQVPSRKVAVHRYSGSWSESKYKDKLAKLQSFLEKDNVKIRGEPIFARFNSPFRLWFLRRNEIWQEIE